MPALGLPPPPPNASERQWLRRSYRDSGMLAENHSTVSTQEAALNRENPLRRCLVCVLRRCLDWARKLCFASLASKRSKQCRTSIQNAWGICSSRAIYGASKNRSQKTDGQCGRTARTGRRCAIQLFRRWLNRRNCSASCLSGGQEVFWVPALLGCGLCISRQSLF